MDKTIGKTRRDYCASNETKNKWHLSNLLASTFGQWYFYPPMNIL